MSSLVLQLPNNYVEIENEEMEYIDGGWSASVLEKNLRGLCTSSGAFRMAMGGFVVKSTWTYWTATTVIGAKVAASLTAAASALTGPLGIAVGGVAALGAGGAIWYLGNNRKFY
ncbi:hypothetical protein ACFLKB_00455 [Clostridium sp. FAM 1755]|uniref:hypothetical protein n=1 Tax=Clostridium caseinilyticum TaxID=3350403 RepID=UPI0038F639E7